MKAWVFSDLHIDVNRSIEPFQLPQPWPEHDLVVIAGDVCEGVVEGVRWIAERALNARPVVYVPGNHEFYGRDRHAELEAGRETAARHPNIHVLDRDAVSIGGVTVLGATLWTDYAIYGAAGAAMALAERLMSDHRVISNGARAWTAADALDDHERARIWLAGALRRSRGPTLVVTHHCPSPASIAAKFRLHPLTPAFASDLDHLVAGADIWVHGHTHAARDHRVGKCRVVNNPRGYVRHELTGFDPALVVAIG
jgi:predicted phosphodiesterase